MAKRAGPKQRSNAGLLGGVIVVALVLAGILILVSNRSNPAPSAGPEVPRTAAEGTRSGKPDAPLRIDIFSDFQCSHCKDAATLVVPEIEREYVAAGKVQIHYRFYAVIGPESVDAAKGAVCAAEQGKFWPYHDKIFAAWRGVQKGTFTYGALQGFAKDLGLDTAAWGKCFASTATSARLAADKAEGDRMGVRGTPYFLFRGKGEPTAIPGMAPYAEFKKAIDSILARQ